MRPIFKVLIFITFLFYFSCEEAENEFLTNSSDIISIEYGTSFGNCVGYCINSIEISGTDIMYSAVGWTTLDKVPDIHISGVIPQEDWNKLVSKIDLVIFRNMDEITGCPDCADGGAEWIKITTDKFVHKVTFEYNNEPEQVQDYINDLRLLMQNYL
jgi:hypothetical protein